MAQANDDVVVEVMIEIPKGSRNKYEYDQERGFFRLNRMLYSPVHYPADYGSVLNTLSGDGDPLDALVLLWEPTFPGCVIDARPVGLFRMRDEKGSDEKILCVPIQDPIWSPIKTLDQVPPHLVKEIEHFFDVYRALEENQATVEGWDDRDAAVRIVREAQQRFRESSKSKQ